MATRYVVINQRYEYIATYRNFGDARAAAQRIAGDVETEQFLDQHFGSKHARRRWEEESTRKRDRAHESSDELRRQASHASVRAYGGGGPNLGKRR